MALRPGGALEAVEDAALEGVLLGEEEQSALCKVCGRVEVLVRRAQLVEEHRPRAGIPALLATQASV
jgi:hypothetical protein